MKKIFKFMLCVLVVTVCALAFVGCDNTKKPSESTVIKCLAKVDDIASTEAVKDGYDPTESNPTIEYTAKVYFCCVGETVGMVKISGGSVVAFGVNAGGCVEVYETEEDATQRNEELNETAKSAHTTVGTIVIRTTEYKTSTAQQALLDAIVEAFK